jgi:O-antigen/teichoic acid export membrane protein
MTEPDAAVGTHDLRGRFVRGFAWHATGRAAAQLVTWGSTLVALRFLTPVEYGTMGLVMIYMLYAEVAVQLGLRPALVQRERVGASDYGAVLALGTGFSIVLAGLTVAVAPWLAAAFHDPQVTAVFSVAALGLPLTAASIVPVAALERRVDFRALSLIELAASSVAAASVLLLVMNGFGVWALVAGWIVLRGVRTAGAWWWARVPLGRASFRRLSPLMRFGSWIMADGLLWSLYSTVDSIVVGRMLGPAALGVYTTARTVGTVPVRRVAPLVYTSSFALFSRISTQPERLRSYVLRLSRVVAATTVPTLVGLALVAPDAIPLVLSSRWEAAVRPAQVLAVVGIFRLQAPILVPAIQTLGRPDWNTRITVVGAVVLLLACLLGMRATGGMEGVLVALVVVEPLLLGTRLWVLGRLIGLKVRAYLRALGPGFLASLPMGVAVAGVGLACEGQPPALRLGLMVLTGLTCYLAVLMFAFPAMVREARVVLHELRG